MHAPELTAAGAEWTKARASTGNTNCVEVARNLPGLAAVRDSKDPGGPALTFAPAVFAAFVRSVRNL